MTCIFGPVRSRRLGRSLGIDLFSSKICNLNCIYCEVGRTVVPVTRRGAYTDVAVLLAEIDEVCADAERMAETDVVTVTAKGEPTLHTGLGEILRHLKSRSEKPVAVLTNGTTLTDPEVREALLVADIVAPSLDSARESSFCAVDRPAPGIGPAKVIEGLTRFSSMYSGALWLEILLVRGVNDAPEDIDALLRAVRPMRIEKIQLNTVMRPPAEESAQPVSREVLTAVGQRFQAALGIPVELPFVQPEQPEPAPCAVAAETGQDARGVRDGVLEKIIAMVQRRPCTAADIDRIFHLGGPERVEQLLKPLLDARVLHQRNLDDVCFYQHVSLDGRT
ncbi:MAG: radical SAM protein [Desulfobulbus sp.]|jgi:wyosine [tRNA(Phe)-imidazoG37] synthetase (radical SAM superfamily)